MSQLTSTQKKEKKGEVRDRHRKEGGERFLDPPSAECPKNVFYPEASKRIIGREKPSKEEG